MTTEGKRVICLLEGQERPKGVDGEEEFNVLDVVAARLKGAVEEEESVSNEQQDEEQEPAAKRAAQLEGNADSARSLLKLVQETQTKHEQAAKCDPPALEDAQDSMVIPPRMTRASNVVSFPGAFAVSPGPFAVSPGADYEINDDEELGGTNGSGAARSASSAVMDSMTAASASRLAVANPVEETNPQELQHARELRLADEATTRRQKDKQWKTSILLAGLVIVAIVVVSVALLVPGKNEKVVPTITVAPTMAPSEAPTTVLSFIEGRIMALLEPDTRMAIQHGPSSPQSRAFQWLLEDAENLPAYSDAQIQQKFALAALYFSTKGDSWMNRTNWLNHNVSECEWFNKPDFARKSALGQIFKGYLDEFAAEPMPRQHCNTDGIYQHLWLDLNNLVGTIPEEIYMLSSLQTLSLSNNKLSGSIPTSIGRLSALEGLVIFDQPTDGNIPSEMGLLTKLKSVILNNGNHQGTLPVEFWGLTNIATFAFTLTPNLQGSIPSEIANMSNLRWLVFDGCSLTGTLPKELGKIPSLEWLVFRDNMITGTVPSELGTASNLVIAAFRGNALDGRLPSEVGLLTALTQFGHRGNQVSGQIPSELGLLSGLTQGLHLRQNAFTGTIPTELGLLTGLHELWLQDNDLSGPIPSEFAELTTLGYMVMANNNLSGSIPTDLSKPLPNLHTLSLGGNLMLSGTVPEGICNLTGTCTMFKKVAESCLYPQGLHFNCTELLCGCDCPCGIHP
ncbi:LRR receptor-like serine threonine-protein kinase At4g08850 [Seminavis robusta]|uniref:LRR receptor-like serine threonine-protein kinase At4g08850 n=1 Tax=Seminavis robusta TaxID=568900 RepID=A0A9N8HTX5_9STRA|nr:LRR receptor-like serine threonine-protein kinase At4g08850 [Seminavis robusta]|eukprot:Sro1566_g282920.1 LRR receptor-like serine threonine-protein kinase At4g08850 (736) ;mRNA; r:17936-20230